MKPTLLNEDGFIIKTLEDQLYIIGGAHKGCIYGVVELLEQYLGCRKFSPDVEVIPSLPTVILPVIDRSDAPVNDFRAVNGEFCKDDDYQDFQRLDEQDEVFAEGFYVHTFHKLIPWKEYFTDHPEYFAWMNGKRIIDQPCLTHPDVLRIAIERLRAEMELQPDKQLWSVSQNDNFSYCQCENCRRVIEEEQSPVGPLIRFVNEVAERFPDKTISTLAYQWSRKAPVVTSPRDNVQVMLCTIELNRSLPIADDPGSRSFIDDMGDWGKICQNIYLWDYTVNFSHLVAPFPNLHVIQPNIRLFTKNNIHWHFQQTNTGNGHEFSELKSYLISRLLWNPSVNSDSIITDFLTGYYGSAAPFIREYVLQMEREIIKSGERLDIFGHPVTLRFSLLSKENVHIYDSLFDLAEEAVSVDPARMLHVKTARLPLMYAKMEIGKNDMFGPRGWYSEQEGKFLLNQEMAETLEDFYQTCRFAGVETINESGLTAEQYYQSTGRFIQIQVEGNLAFRKKTTASPLPSPKYGNGDLAYITNGVLGAADFRVHWLGWEAQDFSLFIDLDTLCAASEIQISSLYDPIKGTLALPAWHASAGGGSWVFIDEVVVR
jgi:hypothetical protein